MTNPTSYTDEQVLARAQIVWDAGRGETSEMLRSLLADRQRLQAEVEALRWLPLDPCPTEAPIGYDIREAQCWSRGFTECLEVIEKHRAKINETKETGHGDDA